jgi:hypothetical protein
MKRGLLIAVLCATVLVPRIAANATMPVSPSYSDDFTVADRNLYGYNSWGGANNTNQIYITGNTVRLQSNNSGDRSNSRGVSTSGPVWFHFLAKSGTSIGSTFWYLELQLNSGEQVQWYGADNSAKGRYNNGGSATNTYNLTSSWADLDLRLDFVTHVAYWYANGTLLGSFSINSGASSVTNITLRFLSLAGTPTMYVDEFRLGSPPGPTVTINQATSQADPTSTSPINFTVVFSESVSDFATGDVTLGGTASATTATITGSGTTYNVAVSGMKKAGTVIASIPAGVATGTNGPNAASTSSDNIVTYQSSSPGDTTVPIFGVTILPSATYNTTTPTIQITAQDSGAGLSISTAQFRYSVDGGTTWSEWLGRSSLQSLATCNNTGGNLYWYRTMYVPNYTISDGDHLEFDIWISNDSINGSLELELTATPFNLRGSGITDQGGISAHPGTNLVSQARNKWYHRDFNLSTLAGNVVSALETAHELDYADNGSHQSNMLFRNVRIYKGSVVKLDVYQDATSYSFPPDTGPFAGYCTSGCSAGPLFAPFDPDTNTTVGCTGSNGSTAAETISARIGAANPLAASVPGVLAVGSNNRIQFRMADMNGNFAVSSVFTITVDPTVRPTLSVKRATGVKIDGDPSDWNLAEFTSTSYGGTGLTGDMALVGYHNGAGYYGNACPGTTPPASTADFRARVWSRHDDTYLYFLARMDDDNIKTEFPQSQNWANDCIEIYIDPGHDHGTAMNAASDIQLVIDAANQMNVYGPTGTYYTNLMNGISSAVVQGSYGGYAGWWCEVRILKSALDPDLPSSTGGFGVNFNFRDKDYDGTGGIGTESSLVDWSGDGPGCPEHKPDQWGDTSLADTAVPNMTLNVKPVTGPISIDGSSSDWNLSEFTTFIRGGTSGSGDEAFVGYDSGTVYRGGWCYAEAVAMPTSAADHSATVYSRHDATYQYFLVQIVDDDVQTASSTSPWPNDCVEIYIDPANAGGSSPLSGSGTTSAIQLGVDAANRKAAWPPCAYATQVLEGMTTAVSVGGGGWTLEVRILKSAVDPDLPASGTFGVDFNFRDNDNDNDPTKTTLYSWRDPYRTGPDCQCPTKIPDNWGDGSNPCIPPVAPTSAASDRNNFCADDSGKINLSVTDGSGTALRWFTGGCGGTDIGTGNPLNIDSPTATTTYSARWENSCGSSLCADVTVSVNGLPAMPTGASADPATICSVGGSSTLSASVGAGEVAAWYTTPTGGTTFDTGSPSVNPASTAIYYVAARDTTTLCESSSRASVTVNVEPATTYYRDADHDTYGNASVTTQACGAPSGYVADSTDCDDTNDAINPAATEVCDTVDNDCDGGIDEGAIGPIWYQDLDGDNYGTTAATLQACVQPVGFAANSTDCDDTKAAINPAATEVCDGVDNDCDGSADEGVLTTYYHDADSDTYGDPTDTTEACSAPTGYVVNNTDCNDADAAINPAATEVHDGVDNDCDTLIDEGVENAYYRDADGDTYGDPNDVVYATTAPTGYVADNMDCDDGNPAVNPGATEVCNGVDDDCDTAIDEGLAFVRYYPDADADTYGDMWDEGQEACVAPEGYITDNTDCDDGNAAVHPGAAEVCNGVDDDCDGEADNGVKTRFYADADGDGFGDPTIIEEACMQPTGFVTNNTDCDDTRASVHPGASETCNGLDDDCDSQTDEGVKLTFYADTDGDNYGDAGNTTQACTAPPGYVTDSTDCDDTRAGVHPGATETCNGLDDDCDTLTDEDVLNTYYEDSDGDSYGNPNSGAQACNPPENFVANNQDCNDADAAIHPNAPEVCNGVDDDCDGSIDEGVKLTFYADGDGDGYGNAAVSQEACSAPTGYVADNTDCNDNCATCHPGATEVCDGEDNDCDSAVDEDVKTTFYQDADSDGYGNPAVTTQACSAPPGYVTDNTDCNDGDATAHSLPVAPTLAASDRDSFCADDAGTIDLSVTGGEGTTLRWFTGGCGSTEIGTGNPLTIASPTSTTTYYARWENSCGNSECAEVTVTVMDTPPCSIGGPDSVGSGTTNTYDGPAGMDQYLWQITGDGTINEPNTEPSVSVTAGTAGSYTLTLTVTTEGGCSSSCELPVAITGITISGTVSFSTGSSAAYSFTRTVKLVVKDGSGGSLATLTQSLNFTNSSGTASASYVLPGLSAEARSISAKTAWHLRKKTTFTPSGGAATVNFTLLGGDLNTSNTVNVLDYAIMAGRWMTIDPVAAAADINGDGQVQLLDYTILKSNWFQRGEEE